LRRYLDSSNGTVFRHVADFVDLNARFSGQRGFQLIRQRRGFRISAWERTHKSRKLRLCQGRRKVNAGDSGGDQKLRETSFTGRCAQRHAVQQNLVTGGAQQQSTAPAFIESVAQFFPGAIELGRCPRMPNSYRRANFSRMFKLRTNVRAPPRVSALIQ
jgi:hypothetical protein